jgi:hypothetical protein
MFGILRNLFGNGEEGFDMKGDMVSALETAVQNRNSSKVVNCASSLRNVLRTSEGHLSKDEKVRVVKALNKAKVRALLGGTTESYSTFKMLDSISSDVVTLL